MAGHNPFKHYGFPKNIILLAVRLNCRYPLIYRDVRDMLAVCGISVDGSTIYRGVKKFGPQIAKRCFADMKSKGLGMHIDETYIKVSGEWKYLWRGLENDPVN